MKKIVLIAMILIPASIGVWMMQTSTHRPETPTIQKTPAQTVEGDLDKIQKQLKPENISNNEWKEINNYAIRPENLITTSNAESFFNTAKNNLPEIYNCLKKDFCGMEPSENDPYFDDQRTPAHILLNRNLQIIKESLKKNPSLSNAVDWDLMDQLANSQQEMLEVEALDIIENFNPSREGVEGTLKAVKNFKGTSKADSLIRVSSRASVKDKQLIINEIEEVFATSDAHTVISVLERMDQMQLSKESMLKSFRNLCHFKNDANPGNWKMIHFLANKLNSEFNKLCQ